MIGGMLSRNGALFITAFWHGPDFAAQPESAEKGSFLFPVPVLTSGFRPLAVEINLALSSQPVCSEVPYVDIRTLSGSL
jgi:hypothetical protein